MMPTIQNDTYSGGSGSTLKGGINTYPAWRQAIAKDTWGTVSTGNTLASLDPTLNPAHWQSGMDWGGRGVQMGYLSWTGISAGDGKLYYPYGGGHTDYGGNEPYVLDIRQPTPTWVMIRPPSGSLLATPGPLGPGYPVTTRDGLESTKFYSDGRIRAMHSYSNHCYVPAVGNRPACIIITRLNAEWYAPTGQHRRSYKFNLSTGETTLFSDYSAISGQQAVLGNEGACDYDPSRDCVWHMGNGGNRLIKIDMTTGVSVGVGPGDAAHVANSDTMVYVPGLDVLVNIIALKFLSPVTGLSLNPSVSGSWSSGLSIVNFDGIGADWVPEWGCIAIWNNSSVTKEISTLTPTGSATDPWVKGVRSPSGGVTPTTFGGGGTFGRLGYSPELGGLFLHNSSTGSVYFHATK